MTKSPKQKVWPKVGDRVYVWVDRWKGTWVKKADDDGFWAESAIRMLTWYPWITENLRWCRHPDKVPQTVVVPLKRKRVKVFVLSINPVGIRKVLVHRAPNDWIVRWEKRYNGRWLALDGASQMSFTDTEMAFLWNVPKLANL